MYSISPLSPFKLCPILNREDQRNELNEMEKKLANNNQLLQQSKKPTVTATLVLKT